MKMPGDQETNGDDTSSARRAPALTPSSIFDGAPPARSAKAADQIVEAIRIAIVTGKASRGDRLPNERDLAKEFNVSQPTIREAIRVLEAIGLVAVQHGRGAYVVANSQNFISRILQTLAQVEDVGILDVMDLRLCLSPYSAARAAKNATPAVLERIEQLDAQVGAATESHDMEAAAPVLLQLMSAISAASEHPLLFAFEGFLNELTVGFFVTAVQQDPDAFVRAWEEWSEPINKYRQRLVTALRTGDEDQARTAMAAQIEYQIRVIRGLPNLSDTRLADPAFIRTFANEALRVPAFHDLKG